MDDRWPVRVVGSGAEHNPSTTGAEIERFDLQNLLDNGGEPWPRMEKGPDTDMTGAVLAVVEAGGNSSERGHNECLVFLGADEGISHH